MTHHTVRSWSAFFQAIKAGEKTHDLRHNDRNYAKGDILTLLEFDPFSGTYTGEEIAAEVTYITDRNHACAFSSAILPKDYCILSIKVIDGSDQ